MGGPEMAPQPPGLSSRPGDAVALLVNPCVTRPPSLWGAPKWPPNPPDFRRAPATPGRSSLTRASLGHLQQDGDEALGGVRNRQRAGALAHVLEAGGLGEQGADALEQQVGRQCGLRQDRAAPRAAPPARGGGLLLAAGAPPRGIERPQAPAAGPRHRARARAPPPPRRRLHE